MVDERRDDFGAPLDDDSPSMDALNGSMDVGPLDDDDIDDIMSQPGKAGPGEIALDARPKIHAASLSSAELFAEGKLDNKPLGEFLNERGCDGVPPGTSRLWYVGNADGGGTWMYATAPGIIKGAVKPGYDVTRLADPLAGYWAPPAGYVESGESVPQAVLREAREETGLEIALDGLAEVYSRADVNVLIVAYRAHVIGGALRAGDDALEAAYFAPGQLPQDPPPTSGAAIDEWFYGVIRDATARWRPAR